MNEEQQDRKPMATPQEQIKFLLRYLLYVLIAVMIAPIIITLVSNLFFK